MDIVKNSINTHAADLRSAEERERERKRSRAKTLLIESATLLGGLRRVRAWLCVRSRFAQILAFLKHLAGGEGDGEERGGRECAKKSTQRSVCVCKFYATY